MRVYIAGAYSRREALQDYATLLRELGHIITAHWLDGVHAEKDHQIGGPFSSEIAIWAMEDCADISQADLVLCFTDGTRSRGGRHVELGMAIALQKEAWIIGPREHVFHYLPHLMW